MRTFLSILLLVLISSVTTVNAQEGTEVCKPRRNAPPTHSYYWPPNSTVKVYFVRDMFTPAQRQTLGAAMITWTLAASEAGAHVKFVDAGESEGVNNCNSCLTVTRREVYKQDRKHYAFFYPLRQDMNGLLISAWIDFDFATTGPKALQGFMAHELGHGLGLWDCLSCGKKQTIMSGFRDINRDNGLIAPSLCDLEVVRQVYEQHKRANVGFESAAAAARVR